MATKAEFTTRARDEIYAIYSAFQDLNERIGDLVDEVQANGGAAGLYGTSGEDFPPQEDGLTYTQLAAGFAALTALIGEPTTEQKYAIIVCRRK